MTYAAPMRPAPMMPTVLPCSKLPTNRVGSQPLYKFALMNLSPSTTRLAAANVSAKASSAVVSVKTPAIHRNLYITRVGWKIYTIAKSSDTGMFKVEACLP